MFFLVGAIQQTGGKHVSPQGILICSGLDEEFLSVGIQKQQLLEFQQVDSNLGNFHGNFMWDFVIFFFFFPFSEETERRS